MLTTLLDEMFTAVLICLKFELTLLNAVLILSPLPLFASVPVFTYWMVMSGFRVAALFSCF
jgi:hypothetical protein